MKITTGLSVGILTIDLSKRKVCHYIDKSDNCLHLNKIVFYASIQIEDRIYSGWTGYCHIPENFRSSCKKLDHIFIAEKSLYCANTGELIN